MISRQGAVVLSSLVFVGLSSQLCAGQIRGKAAADTGTQSPFGRVRGVACTARDKAKATAKKIKSLGVGGCAAKVRDEAVSSARGLRDKAKATIKEIKSLGVRGCAAKVRDEVVASAKKLEARDVAKTAAFLGACVGASLLRGELGVALSAHNARPADAEATKNVHKIACEMGYDSADEIEVGSSPILAQQGIPAAAVKSLFGKPYIYVQGLESSITPEQLRFVIGHEVAHLKRHHVTKQLVANGAIFGISMLLTKPFVRMLEKRNHKRLARVVRFAVRPLGALALALVSGGVISRACERQADGDSARGLNAAADGAAAFKAVRSLVVPAEQRRGFFGRVCAAHPPIDERIAYLEKMARKQQQGMPRE